MKVIEMKIDDVKPYENNPRNNEEAVDGVANSIKQFGWQQPIVVDKENVIIVGHTRYKAAQKLGLKVVPVIVAELSEEKAKAYRLADNKTNEAAEWNFDKLQEELDKIINIDMSDFGFDVDNIIDEIEDKQAIEDEYTEKNDIECHNGDIWQLGNHKLMCGDSSNKENWSKLMCGEKGNMVFTDPPYGVAIGDKNKQLNKYRKSNAIDKNIMNDNISADELYKILVKAMTNLRENCLDDAVYFVTSPQGGDLGMMMTMMKDAGLPVRHILIWKKNSATFSMGRLDYDYQHEPIFYTWTKSHKNYRKGEYRTTIWEYDKPKKCDLHPTMKPVALVANALKDGTKKDDIVLDAFGGSGTTLIACEQLCRKARLMEMDPHYCSVIISRWEQLTGDKAKLISSE